MMPISRSLLPRLPMFGPRSARSDLRPRRDRLGHPGISADNAAGADDDVAENRRFGVDRDAVLDRRMPLAALDDPSALVARKTHRPQRHALINLDPVADDRRLADDHAGAVVDEKVLADP